jgi:hypothetical protein
MRERPPVTIFGDGYQPDVPVERPPAPGTQALLLAVLVLGVILMGIQLWLLTVALDLYLGGAGDGIWWLAVVSGLVFAGGLFALWLTERRPRVRR